MGVNPPPSAGHDKTNLVLALVSSKIIDNSVLVRGRGGGGVSKFRKCFKGQVTAFKNTGLYSFKTIFQIQYKLGLLIHWTVSSVLHK